MCLLSRFWITGVLSCCISGLGLLGNILSLIILAARYQGGAQLSFSKASYSYKQEN